MKLSILIVNWNSKDYLRHCLRSIRETCGHLSPQVVVVDGGSFDGCAEMISGEFEDVDFIQLSENLGFGHANNIGFSNVIGELVLLLNPDTVLQSGAVDAMISALQQVPDAGLVGAHLLNTDGSLQIYGIHCLPTPWNCAVDSSWVRRRWWRRNSIKDTGPAVNVEAVSGACMLMLSETFRRVGGFTPQYYMYGEDMDLCLKVSRIGMNVCYAPDARVIHHGGGSTRAEPKRFPIIMIRESHWIYMNLNHGRPAALLYRWMMSASAGMRCMLMALLMPFGKSDSRRERHWALIKWWTILRWSIGLERV